MQNGLSLGESIETYSLLTVGDGLVSQIPALLISVASGLIVTRAASDADLGSDVVSQFGNQDRALRIAAISVASMAIIPGLPKIPFILIAVALWIAATPSKGRNETEVLEQTGTTSWRARGWQ